MEIVREGVEKLGFSQKVANRIAGGIEKSSSAIYDSKWRVFSSWCEKNNIVPLEATIQQVSDFFNYLFEELSLEVSTIRGYRASISRVLRLVKNFNTSDDDHIHELMRNFAKNRPCKKKLYPKWDLRVVLNSLMYAPYEPISVCNLTFLAHKTAFLLLLASGARRGELHALDIKKFVKYDKPESFWLAPNDSFRAKNYNVNTGQCDFKGFKITSLKDYLGPDLAEENKLCPVRCLKEYLKRTKHKRGAVRSLFISNNPNKPCKGVHINSISAWMKSVISRAYDTVSNDKSALLNRSAHEIRAQAASYSLYANYSMEQIMRQCRWSQHTTFTSYYLKDVAGQLDGLLVLPPLTAAGSVINRK